MSKKDLPGLKDRLDPMTKNTPSIHVASHSEQESLQKEKTASPAPDRDAQYLLKMTRKQRRQIVRLAAMEDLTIRGFILSALKDKGLEVTEEDMLDLRRKQ